MVIVLPLVVFADIMVFGYTMSFDPIAIRGKALGPSMPVADPFAGSVQDHPWLTHIGRSLRQGRLPLVNLQNGLGAPLLESLQPGVFYPPNVLLVAFDLDGAWFFGVFMLLHVVVLGLTSSMLFRLYLPAAPARVLAIAFALSPMTFSAINMVHFRAFVWVPAIAWAAVRIARGQARPGVLLIGAGAVTMSLTAGNPQETALCLVAVSVIFSLELLRQGGARARAALLFGAAVGGGILAAAPSILPYLEAVQDGTLETIGTAQRYLRHSRWEWLPAWFIPAYQGVSPRFLLSGGRFGEFTTFSFAPAIVLLVIAGLVSCSRKALRPTGVTLWVFAGLVCVIAIAMLKIFGFPIIDAVVSQLPFFNSIRYLKYVNYIHLLAAVAAAIALAHVLQLPLKERKVVVAGALVVLVAIVLAAFSLAAANERWRYAAGGSIAGWAWAGAALCALALGWGLVRTSGVPWLALALTMALAAAFMRPYGFYRAAKQYPDLVYAPGWPEERSAGRILAPEMPNVNLLRSYESLGVFDPVLNATFSSFMRANFQVVGRRTSTQPVFGLEISAQQVDALRLMGVTSIVGYKVAGGAVTKRAEGWWQVQRPLPRVFLIPEAVERRANDACLAGDYGQAVNLVEQELLARPIAFAKGRNTLGFVLSDGGKGTLVALQTFTQAWQLEDRAPRIFCGLFTAWPGEYQGHRNYRIGYWPRGLTRGLGLALVGALVVAGACIYVARAKRPASVEPGLETG